MNILKLIQIYTITQLLFFCISSLHAKEIQVFLPLSASGGNNNKLSTSEKTSEFSTTGYGLAYVFKNNFGLGYISSTATYVGSAGSVISQNQTVQANAVELSYFKGFKKFSLQLGLGSIISGTVSKHEQSGVDVLANANSKSLVNGSTTFGNVGYKMFGLNFIVGYRIWDYYAQHKGSSITRGVGNFNYSETFVGIGF